VAGPGRPHSVVRGEPRVNDAACRQGLSAYGTGSTRWRITVPARTIGPRDPACHPLAALAVLHSAPALLFLASCSIADASLVGHYVADSTSLELTADGRAIVRPHPPSGVPAATILSDHPYAARGDTAIVLLRGNLDSSDGRDELLQLRFVVEGDSAVGTYLHGAGRLSGTTTRYARADR